MRWKRWGEAWRGQGRRTAGTQGSGAVEGQGGACRRGRKNPDGSQYVYYPEVPESPRHPEAEAGLCDEETGWYRTWGWSRRCLRRLL